MDKNNLYKIDKNLKQNIKIFENWKEREKIYKKWIEILSPDNNYSQRYFARRAINKYLKKNKLKISQINTEHLLEIRKDKDLQQSYNYVINNKITDFKRETLIKSVKSLFRQKVDKLHTEDLEILFNFLKKTEIMKYEV
jgi:UDP-N-acetyl-D-mannosaminuronic acid transferase (WecB/TagA/CpsF family)